LKHHARPPPLKPILYCVSFNCTYTQEHRKQTTRKRPTKIWLDGWSCTSPSIKCYWFHRLACHTVSIKLIKGFLLHIIYLLTFWKFFTSCFDQYGHHQVFKIVVEETALLLLSWLGILFFNVWSPLYTCVFQAMGCSSCCVVLCVFFTRNTHAHRVDHTLKN
jgi:hypothetical protein